MALGAEEAVTQLQRSWVTIAPADILTVNAIFCGFEITFKTIIPVILYTHIGVSVARPGVETDFATY